eukprot:TRINITY_DN5923_c0_g1_i2.p1 TRINITY_DN5923_c0_g1~~TRINITY_DN5923_c0_g1_i2.p1  ORF type:complete len:432 (+),score=31.74 TRINITY_DN5923_c0_g1_i2:1179-2474(+)
MYYYNIYKNIWFKFTVDPEEVRLKKIPKYFKYAHLGEDKYVLLGGFDVDLNTSSNKAFLFQGGHFTRADSMITPRQYFGVAVDDTFVYAVAGFNSEEGVIGKCERMHIQTKKWEEIEPLNVPRMNTAAIRIGEKYVYIFGGQSDKGFLDSIERYNLDLNIWTLLDVSLPTRVSNLTVLQASNSTLILLGGLKYVRKIITEGEREREEYRPEIDKNAYFFDLFKQELIVRLFCQFKKKLQSAQVNGKGHIYCLYMNNNRELPHLFIADLNEVYPDYSPYSWMLRLGYREKKLEKISLSKSNSELEAEPKNVQSVELIELKGEYKPQQNMPKWPLPSIIILRLQVLLEIEIIIIIILQSKKYVCNNGRETPDGSKFDERPIGTNSSPKCAKAKVYSEACTRWRQTSLDSPCLWSCNFLSNKSLDKYTLRKRSI